MATNFGKLDFATGFNPTSAFPLDARSYFEDLDTAKAAAATAKEAGDTTTRYYYGQIVCVLTNSGTNSVTVDLYKITPVYDADTDSVTGGLLPIISGEDSVTFTENLTLTNTFGKYKPDETGRVIIPSLGKTAQEVILDAFVEEKDPTIVQPSATVTGSDFKAYEVGTEVTPSYFVNFDKGSYEFNTDTGVTVTGYSVEFNGETLTTQDGTFGSVVVGDTTNLKATATVSHSDGTDASTNLGNESGTMINAGDVSAQSDAITGYRNTFYGTVENKDSINSTTIRSLSGKSNKALSNGSTFTINIPVGAVRIIIAYPATLRDLENVIDVNGMNASITSSFVKNSNIQVGGVNDANPMEYKLYTLDYAEANNKENNYKVTI